MLINYYRTSVAGFREFVAYRYLLFILAVVVFWALCFSDTIFRMVSFWHSSTTYTHCFTVLPISFYLVWINRQEFMRFPPSLYLRSIPLIVFFALVWAAAKLGKVDAVEYLATIAILIVSIVFFVGRRAAQVLWFPLLFLFFLAPIGDELIPFLQTITAKAAVWLLGLTNIPVFFEGLFISIPEGKFVVAEACSGIRFFISTIFLGFLVANLFYRSYLKRILFIIFAILLPVAANILRVYGIILIGHFSEMKYAVGADHLIYGWVFFSIITVVMIIIGRFFRDATVNIDTAQSVAVDAGWQAWPRLRIVLPLLTGLFGFLIIMQQFTTRDFFLPDHILADDIGRAYVSLEEPPFSLIDKDVSALERKVLSFSEYNGNYYLVAEAFSSADEASELISWRNRLYDPDVWSIRNQQHHEIESEKGPVQVQILELISGAAQPRVVLYWYRVPGYSGYNSVWIKVMQTINVFLGKGRYGVLMQMTFEGYDQEVNQQDALVSWVDENYSDIERMFLFE